MYIKISALFFSCTALVIWLSLPHFDKSGDFSLPLPNPLNMSFHPSIALRIGLFTVPLCESAILHSVYTHMYYGQYYYTCICTYNNNYSNHNDVISLRKCHRHFRWAESLKSACAYRCECAYMASTFSHLVSGKWF